MKNKPLLEGYIHLRQRGRKMLTSLTIAYLLISKDDESSLSIGISVHDKRSGFRKKRGRDIAHGRMLKRPYGIEKFEDIDTKVFKSEKGKQELHKWILDTYITNVSVNQIKRHIYKLRHQLY